jgi:adenylosuccinate synthase
MANVMNFSLLKKKVGDTNYEKGTHDFAGMALNDDLFGNNDRVSGGPLASSGTTAHGCGANRAKRVLRSKGSLFARDIPELKEFICDVPTEIMKRLDAGQAGLLEIAQGFQLSNMLANFYPHVTSRNCTVAAGLDDLMVPPYYAGNVILNVRTYPIRINSNKWVDKKTGRHLTQEEVKKFDEEVKASWATNNNEHGMELPYRKVLGNSGHGYPDQKEITWEELTEQSGSREPLMEITSVTKLPRRVFTFSKINLDEAIRHNQTNGYTIISVNFMNYVDAGMFGKRGKAYGIDDTIFTEKTVAWMKENLGSLWNRVRFIGTGPNTDDKIFIV